MFESGRWRRYHSEVAFLENIREAKRAVQTWRALATGGDVAEAVGGASPAFGWSPATMPRKYPRDLPVQAEPVQPPQPNTLTEAPVVSLAAVAAREPLSAPEVRPPVAATAVVKTLVPDVAPPTVEDAEVPERMVEFTFNLDGLEAKYPLLRNAF